MKWHCRILMRDNLQLSAINVRSGGWCYKIRRYFLICPTERPWIDRGLLLSRGLGQDFIPQLLCELHVVLSGRAGLLNAEPARRPLVNSVPGAAPASL